MNSIGIIGMGTIGTALAHGVHRARPQLEIFGTRRARPGFPEFVTRCDDNRELARRTRVILLCVKPAHVDGALEEIRPELKTEHILISMCAGVTLGSLERSLAVTANIARAMPNIPCELNEGVSALCFSSRWARNCKTDIIRLLEAVGRVVLLEERHFDAVTAISGCGPAYVCVIIEALSDAGVKQGLPRDAARLLVAQTLLGSAQLVLQSEKHPAEIRDRVTTPGGCTIDALTSLEQGGLRATLISAVVTAATKSAKLHTR